MTYTKIYFLLSCIFIQYLFSQDTTKIVSHNFPDSTYHVSAIYFQGNETTKEYVIEREMSLKKKSLITHEAISYNINRIYSLQLFNTVNIQVVPQDSINAELFVIVTERWYFYPFPIVGLKDRNWSRLYYGLGIMHTNFGGRNVQVNTQFALGYDPFVSVGYSNPLISQEYNLFFSSRIYYSKTKNRSLLSQGDDVNFDEKNFGVDATLGKRFSLFTTLSLSAEYHYLEVTDNHIGRTLSPTGIDRFISLHANYRYDTRDLKEYPRLGTLANFKISQNGVGFGELNYQRYSLDFRRYIPIYYNMVFLGRIMGSVVSGEKIPNYGHVYFGYSERLRGNFSTILEGENIVGTFAELHIPIISPRYLRFEEIPIEQFRDIRTALYFALFADAGTTWYRNEKVGVNNFISGYGAGFHLLLSYGFVLRIEYAFNTTTKKFPNGEFIFDLGAAL